MVRDSDTIAIAAGYTTEMHSHNYDHDFEAQYSVASFPVASVELDMTGTSPAAFAYSVPPPTCPVCKTVTGTVPTAFAEKLIAV
jgi:hypothetical protein